MYTMMHIAIHDGLNAIHRRSQPYALNLHVPGASVAATVASAAYHTLVPSLKTVPPPITQECIDAGLAVVTSAYSDAMSAIPNSIAKAKGRALGRAAAAAILALRVGDGNQATMVDPDYPQGTEPGEWRFTPGSPFAWAPKWGDVSTFGLRSARQFDPGPPYQLTSDEYTADYNEVKRLGGDGVTTPTDRTTDQTQIALFWWESSPLMWNAIARTVSASQHLDLWDEARLFALLNVGLADGYIAVFATKYHYRFWRPVTAIQLGDDDGNPATEVDPTWTPLEITPPIPDHESGHSVEGGVAAAILREFFGTNQMSFDACSETLPAGQTCDDADPVLRHYHSFSQASAENGLSRILIGFHFRHAVEAGIERGQQIGRFIATHLMRPTG